MVEQLPKVFEHNFDNFDILLQFSLLFTVLPVPVPGERMLERSTDLAC